jgi:tetratricopeptide (TPR) repeat protein
MKKRIVISVFLLLALACKTVPEEKQLTEPADYDQYLSTTNRPTYNEVINSKEFWSKRLRPDSSGVGELGPLAGAYDQLFQITGDPQFLRNAEKLYKKAMEISANDKDAFARGLAHNYISQHRFEEAYALLQVTLEGRSNKHQTKLLLFDTAMEVGDYDKAYEYLGGIKNLKDYHYLIRLAKWNDHRGDLEKAIHYLEEAKAIAESRDSKPLKIWTYSNLGDYYGHAGRIKDAYKLYLKTLALQPDNAYVKKSIAWIIYSEEKNVKEAHRILDSVMKIRKLPDDHIFKAELYEFEGNITKAKSSRNNFIKLVKDGNYGEMYNTYLIEIYSETEPLKALKTAKREVQNRATPMSYHLLALAQLKNGMTKEALRTIELYVEGKTFEPKALFHSALVFKANELTEKVAAIKSQLLDTSFELGPLITMKVAAL